jgi:hypothetical protein
MNAPNKNQQTMPYQYRIRPLVSQDGTFTTRPHLGLPLTESEVVRELTRSCSVSEGDIRSVLTHLRQVLVSAARLTRPSETLFGLFRMGLSSGGALSNPQHPLSFEELMPTVNLYPSLDFQEEFRAGLTLERVGIDSERTPDVQSVSDEVTGFTNRYTVSDVLRIQGSGLRLDPEDSSQGVFLRDAAGVEVRVMRYLLVTEGRLLILMPANLQGSQTLILRVRYGPNLRQSIWSSALQPATTVEPPRTGFQPHVESTDTPPLETPQARRLRIKIRPSP